MFDNGSNHEHLVHLGNCLCNSADIHLSSGSYNAVGTSGAMIGKYERDEMTPSVEMAKKIADALNVSLVTSWELLLFL